MHKGKCTSCRHVLWRIVIAAIFLKRLLWSFIKYAAATGRLLACADWGYCYGKCKVNHQLIGLAVARPTQIALQQRLQQPVKDSAGCVRTVWRPAGNSRLMWCLVLSRCWGSCYAQTSWVLTLIKFLSLPFPQCLLISLNYWLGWWSCRNRYSALPVIMHSP